MRLLRSCHLTLRRCPPVRDDRRQATVRPGCQTKSAKTRKPTVEDAQPSAIAATAKRAGLEVVDADPIAMLRREATDGKQVKAAAQAQRIEANVDDAITKGKITPARRKHWVDLLAADPAMPDVLATLPDNTMPVQPIGHGVDIEGGTPQGAQWFH
jgi:hypothetical protein